MGEKQPFKNIWPTEDKQEPEAKPYSEVAPRVTLEGERIKLLDILNQEIVINDFVVLKSQYDRVENYVVVQCMLKGEKYTFATGSQVILKQLEEIRDKLPVRTTIRRKGRYFTLT